MRPYILIVAACALILPAAAKDDGKSPQPQTAVKPAAAAKCEKKPWLCQCPDPNDLKDPTCLPPSNNIPLKSGRPPALQPPPDGSEAPPASQAAPPTAQDALP
jgi:hypothetical protein